METIVADMEAMDSSTVHLRRDRSAEDHVLEGDSITEEDSKEATATVVADSVTENSRVERDHAMDTLRTEMATPQVTRASIKKRATRHHSPSSTEKMDQRS